MEATDVLVARVRRAHGLRGEVSVQVHTDIPEQRFAPEARLVTACVGHGPFTVRSSRLHQGMWLLTLQEVRDRAAAQALAGMRLYAPAVAEQDGWYESELVGLAAVLPTGTAIGTVTGLVLRPAQDLLVLDVDGREVLLPFVEAIVSDVDVEAKRVVIDPPAGLIGPAEAQ